MSFAGIPSTSSASSSAGVHHHHGGKGGGADMKALSDALSAGDTAGAQKAYAKLQSDFSKNAPQGASATQGSQSQGQQDFTALGKALQSGDIAGAQKAFASMGADFKAAHHHTPTQPSSTQVDKDGDNDGSTFSVAA